MGTREVGKNGAPRWGGLDWRVTNRVERLGRGPSSFGQMAFAAFGSDVAFSTEEGFSNGA